MSHDASVAIGLCLGDRKDHKESLSLRAVGARGPALSKSRSVTNEMLINPHTSSSSEMYRLVVVLDFYGGGKPPITDNVQRSTFKDLGRVRDGYDFRTSARKENLEPNSGSLR
jgi:hypothetical protein